MERRTLTLMASALGLAAITGEDRAVRGDAARVPRRNGDSRAREVGRP